MNRRTSFGLLLLLFLIASTAVAQVPSNSLDDVPPGVNAWVATYQGNLAPMGPNHQLAYVQTGPNEQKVWYTIDIGLNPDPPSQQGGPGAYYNRRYRANESSPWYWQYANSQPISGTVGFIDSVLYSATPRYTDQWGYTWNYIMYAVNQPGPCDGNQLGFATVQYSSDGTHWYDSTSLHRAGGPSAVCAPELGSNLVQAEALGAVDDGQGTIRLIVQDGDVAVLAESQNMDQTHALWAVSSYSNTSQISVGCCNADVSAAGVFMPTLPGTSTSGSLFRTYAYFMNMGMAWDAANGDLYWSRGYPYPFDRRADFGDFIPSPAYTTQRNAYNGAYSMWQLVEGCAKSPAIYPNRHQVYKMHLGTLSNFALLSSGTWTLVADRGNYAGYEQSAVPPYGPGQLVSGQTAGTRDAGAASFLLDGSGNLVRINGSGYVFGASTLMEKLSVGPCRVTGNEKIVAATIP
jgi:hypothetical protein